MLLPAGWDENKLGLESLGLGAERIVSLQLHVVVLGFATPFSESLPVWRTMMCDVICWWMLVEEEEELRWSY